MEGKAINVHAVVPAVALTLTLFFIFLDIDLSVFAAILAVLGHLFALAAITLIWYAGWKPQNAENLILLKSDFADYAGFWSALALFFTILVIK